MVVLGLSDLALMLFDFGSCGLQDLHIDDVVSTVDAIGTMRLSFFVRRSRIPTPLVELLVIRLGSRRQNAATTGTKGYGRASRRAFDLRLRCRLG